MHGAYRGQVEAQSFSRLFYTSTQHEFKTGLGKETYGTKTQFKLAMKRDIYWLL